VPALGRAVGLDVPALIAAMNARARRLGLRHTHFEDPTGLHYGNVSTPRELVVLLRASLAHPLITALLRTWTAEVVVYRRHRRTGRRIPRKRITLVNTDKLLPGPFRILGGKTGYNRPAGYCLAVGARLAAGEGIPSRDLALVVLGSRGRQTRFADVRRVLHALDASRRPALHAQRRVPAAARLPVAAVRGPTVPLRAVRAARLDAPARRPAGAAGVPSTRRGIISDGARGE
jgi:D-alanyl-D-alanine endopeptidase (penicillin-binding protein 7)